MSKFSCMSAYFFKWRPTILPLHLKFYLHRFRVLGLCDNFYEFCNTNKFSLIFSLNIIFSMRGNKKRESSLQVVILHLSVIYFVYTPLPELLYILLKSAFSHKNNPMLGIIQFMRKHWFLRNQKRSKEGHYYKYKDKYVTNYGFDRHIWNSDFCTELCK